MEQLPYSRQSQPAEGPPSLRGAVWAVAGFPSCSHGVPLLPPVWPRAGWPPPTRAIHRTLTEQLRNTRPNQGHLGRRSDSLQLHRTFGRGARESHDLGPRGLTWSKSPLPGLQGAPSMTCTGVSSSLAALRASEGSPMASQATQQLIPGPASKGHFRKPRRPSWPKCFKREGTSVLRAGKAESPLFLWIL